MRDIKFRLWYTNQANESEMIYSNDRYLITLNGTVLENYGESWDKPTWESVFDTYTTPVLMQYTGLKDKNGKEIYEGDIVSQITYEGERRVNVTYYSGSFHAGREFLNNTYFNTTVVIGNIYENPDLLK